MLVFLQVVPELLKFRETFILLDIDICLFSGTFVLASAIKQNEQTPIISVLDSYNHLNWHMNNGFWKFDNINYVGF